MNPPRAYVVYPLTRDHVAGWDYRLERAGEPRKQPEAELVSLEVLREPRQDLLELLAPPKFATQNQAIEAVLIYAATEGVPIEVRNEEGETLRVMELDEVRRRARAIP